MCLFLNFNIIAKEWQPRTVFVVFSGNYRNQNFPFMYANRFFLLAFMLFFGLSSKVSAATTAQTAEVPLEMAATAQSEVMDAKELSKKEKRTMWLAKKIYKKMERKAKKQGLAAPMTSFEDVIVLAGAIVTIAGIISIIFSPITGLVVAGLGLLVYWLGKANGGSISNIF